MKYKWLSNNNSEKLIMFFNGWGMDENAVKHLDPENYDVVMFYDYNNLETDYKLDKKYIETNLIAWSMGVMVASIVAKPEMFGEFKSRVAVNGTLKTVDEKYGIRPDIYDLTVDNFDELGKENFMQNMGVNNGVNKGINIGATTDISSKRGIENQKNELIKMKEYSQINCEPKFKYNKIFISRKDRIIPTKHQVSFWGIEPNLEGGHYPFFNFSKWSELL